MQKGNFWSTLWDKSSSHSTKDNSAELQASRKVFYIKIIVSQFARRQYTLLHQPMHEYVRYWARKIGFNFLRQNLVCILANFCNVLPHQPAFSWVIWKVSTTHGKLRTSAWWPAYWLNKILQKQLRYDFSNIAHLYFWDCLQGVLVVSLLISMSVLVSLLVSQFSVICCDFRRKGTATKARRPSSLSEAQQ